MKLKLKQELVTLQGEVVESDGKPANLGMILANIVLAPHKDKKGFRPLKAWELAKKLNTEEEIELDNSDVVQIKEIVDNNTDYRPFIIAQIQEAFINAEKQTT